MLVLSHELCKRAYPRMYVNAKRQHPKRANPQQCNHQLQRQTRQAYCPQNTGRKEAQSAHANMQKATGERQKLHGQLWDAECMKLPWRTIRKECNRAAFVIHADWPGGGAGDFKGHGMTGPTFCPLRKYKNHECALIFV